jgi:pyruvate dehydrogenase E1 component
MTNLAGHDLPTLLRTFEAIDHDRPTVFIIYTIKGHGLPLAGHKDNHAGLMTEPQMALFRENLGIPPGAEWDPFAGLDQPAAALRRFLAAVPFNRDGPRRRHAPSIPVPAALTAPRQESLSTQQGFGLILNELARTSDPLADRIVTTAPDVTVSTNLGPWVNRRGLYSQSETADVFRTEKVPSTFHWASRPAGQHIELGIAEMNLFMLLSALGLSHSLFGTRLIPIGTLYDPFIQRGLDALNYACYQDARFILVATPSGVTLAPEGGAHQSIGTPLIGLAQPGLAAFEPAFVDELAIILRHAFSYVQADDGGSVYLRLSTRALAQPNRTIDAALAADIIAGGYWLRRPGPNAALAVAVTGAVTPEAIEAVGLMAEDRRDVGLLCVTSADRLYDSPHAASLLAALPPSAALVTVLDGHPATLAWLGGVHGHRTRALGVTKFGQTGTIADLYRYNGIDAAAIMAAAQAMVPGRPIRYLRTA